MRSESFIYFLCFRRRSLSREAIYGSPIPGPFQRIIPSMGPGWNDFKSTRRRNESLFAFMSADFLAKIFQNPFLCPSVSLSHACLTHWRWRRLVECYIQRVEFFRINSLFETYFYYSLFIMMEIQLSLVS